MSVDPRKSVRIDHGQYNAMQEYCDASQAIVANVVRDAIALWLRTEKPRRMAAFAKPEPITITKTELKGVAAR